MKDLIVYRKSHSIIGSELLGGTFCEFVSKPRQPEINQAMVFITVKACYRLLEEHLYPLPICLVCAKFNTLIMKTLKVHKNQPNVRLSKELYDVGNGTHKINYRICSSNSCTLMNNPLASTFLKNTHTANLRVLHKNAANNEVENTILW